MDCILYYTWALHLIIGGQQKHVTHPTWIDWWATKTRYRPPTWIDWWATKNRYRPPTFNYWWALKIQNPPDIKVVL